MSPASSLGKFRRAREETNLSSSRAIQKIALGSNFQKLPSSPINLKPLTLHRTDRIESAQRNIDSQISLINDQSMAQSISALYTTLPLSSDRSSFISKPPLSSFPLSFKPKPSPSSIVSMAADPRGGDLDHLSRVAARPAQPLQPKRRPAAASPVGLWDRFPTARTVQQMMETMERMIEDPLAYTTAYPPPSSASQNGSYSRGRTPWEIKEGESEYKMRFDMPGMTREDVKVWVEEKMLVVEAEKTPKKVKKADENGASGANVNGNGSNESAVEELDEEEEWPAKSFGRYKTRIALPENVQFEKIKAEVKDGVLYINVPKASVSAKVLDIAVQ